MPPVTFVGSLCKIHALLFSKIPDVHDVRTWKFVSFQKIFWVLLHNTRDVTRGARGAIPGRGITAGGQKVPTMSKALFFKTVHLFPKGLRFEHEGDKLVSCPNRRHLTSLRSLHNAHHDCLAKMAKFVYKNTSPSVANY